MWIIKVRFKKNSFILILELFIYTIEPNCIFLGDGGWIERRETEMKNTGNIGGFFGIYFKILFSSPVFFNY
jgi:hypothetical protein